MNLRTFLGMIYGPPQVCIRPKPNLTQPQVTLRLYHPSYLGKSYFVLLNDSMGKFIWGIRPGAKTKPVVVTPGLNPARAHFAQVWLHYALANSHVRERRARAPKTSLARSLWITSGSTKGQG